MLPPSPTPVVIGLKTQYLKGDCKVVDWARVLDRIGAADVPPLFDASFLVLPGRVHCFEGIEKLIERIDQVGVGENILRDIQSNADQQSLDIALLPLEIQEHVGGFVGG